MRLSNFSLLTGAISVGANAVNLAQGTVSPCPGTCTTDDCYNAVAACTAECSNYLVSTTTQCPVTATVTATVTGTSTVTVTCTTLGGKRSLDSGGLAPPQAGKNPVAPGNSVPTNVANVCSNFDQFSSACSCNGVQASTITLAGSTITSTVTTTSTPTTTVTSTKAVCLQAEDGTKKNYLQIVEDPDVSVASGNDYAVFVGADHKEATVYGLDSCAGYVTYQQSYYGYYDPTSRMCKVIFTTEGDAPAGYTKLTCTLSPGSKLDQPNFQCHTPDKKQLYFYKCDVDKNGRPYLYITTEYNAAVTCNKATVTDFSITATDAFQED